MSGRRNAAWTGKRPANKAEAAFHEAATAAGWSVSKRGWPDFFMHRGGEIACVEVKPRGSEPLKFDQECVLTALASYGIPCYRWAPDTGFVRIRCPRRRTRSPER